MPLARIAVSNILKGQRWSQKDPRAAVRNKEIKSNNQDTYPPK